MPNLRNARLHHATHYAIVLLDASKFYLQGHESVNRASTLFETEWDNIRAGQSWVTTHAQDDPLAEELCCHFPNAGFHLLGFRLHPGDWIRWLEPALAAARRLQDRVLESAHLGNLGAAYLSMGDARRAIEFYEQAQRIDHELGKLEEQSADLGNLGSAYLFLGELHRAIEFYEQALQMNRGIGNRRGESANLGNLGSAYFYFGEPRRAVEFYEQQLQIDRELGDRRGEATALGNLGNVHVHLGEPRRGIDYYAQALVIVQDIGDRAHEGTILGNLGSAFADLGQSDIARKYYELDIGK